VSAPELTIIYNDRSGVGETTETKTSVELLAIVPAMTDIDAEELPYLGFEHVERVAGKGTKGPGGATGQELLHEG
jgi:hypothetical protein